MCSITVSSTRLIAILVLSIVLFIVPEAKALAAKRISKGSTGLTKTSSSGGFGTKLTPNSHRPDTSETTLELLRFLKANKADGLNDVDIAFDPKTGVRGLFANRNFKKGQILCKIPSDCALALSDPAKNGEDAPTLVHCGANFLTMYEKSSNSRHLWAPYLNTLPLKESAQFDATPDFFTNEELELLEFPRLIRLAKERRENINTLASELGFSPAELQFATWIASSRTFSLALNVSPASTEEIPTVDERGQIITKAGLQKVVRVLVPFIDMANHHHQPNAKLQLIDPERDNAFFALEATRPISIGKEITIAYGNGLETSVELFLNYGFVPQANQVDALMLKKGGDEVITNLNGWTTTIEEDEAMLAMLQESGENETLQTILKFRIRLKEAYTSGKD